MKLISSILLLIISTLVFFFVAKPLYGEVRQLQTDVSTYNVALNSSIELQKTRDSLVNAYKNIKTEDKKKLAHLLPSTIDNIPLILEIEKIANLHGMPLNNIKFEPKSLESKDASAPNNNFVASDNNPVDILPYNIFPMEFAIEGRYDIFVDFLKDLEDNLRLVDIRSISFGVPPPSAIPGKGVDPNIYSYTLKIETYWLK
jgi:Tfp pilus assembly protein PilO